MLRKTLEWRRGFIAGRAKANHQGDESITPAPVLPPVDEPAVALALPLPGLMVTEGPGISVEVALAQLPGTADPATGVAPLTESKPVQHRRLTYRRVALGFFALMVVAAGALYPQRGAFSAQGADLSRSVIGDERTARLESYYFEAEDRAQKLKYKIFGDEGDPFAARVRVDYIPDPPAPTILYLLPADLGHGSTYVPPMDVMMFMPTLLLPPKTKPARDTFDEGEGVWTTVGLPRTTPSDVLMTKTFIRPDKSRPYANVGVLLVDSRRVKLNMRAGTGDPGTYRGVPGPGTIPKDDYANLLLAFNGGFKGPHGGFGMVADGKEYVPLRNGLASLVVMNTGEIKMGEWGKDLKWSDHMAAVRQNAVLLVANCEMSPRVNEGNDTWGYVAVNSAEFITWRSAVGLTKDGHLMIAAGNSLSAATLARAMWAAGACTAMQLDINTPYVLTSLYTPQADGSLKSERFMGGMPDNPARFLKTNERDFLYLTLDENRYHAR